MPCTMRRTSSSTSANGAAIFWRARPTNSHGPHVGVLYGKRERLEALDFPKLEPAPETVPEQLETGTQNHEGIVGAAAAVDYLASLARADNGRWSSSSRRERLQAVFDAFMNVGRRS